MPATADRDRAFFGHPIGLSTLFFTEMWERFSYYGLRALLILYLVGKVDEGGRAMSEASAGIVLAIYTASVYLLSLPGGWIADRFIGQRRAISFGAVGIIIGSALLAIPMHSLLYPGLAAIAIGTGLLKPNVSTLVGQLYGPTDPRRDAGYTIYYMGINIGALVAPVACGFFAQSETFRSFLANQGIDPKLCWHFAFGAAGVGMTAGLIQYRLGWARLGEAGLRPTIPTDPARAARDRTVLGVIVAAFAVLFGLFIGLDAAGVSVSNELIGNIFGVGLLLGAIALFVGLFATVRDQGERSRVVAILVLFVGCVAFFALFEQASSTLSLYTEAFVRREYLGVSLPASYWQAANSVFILLLAPIAAGIWLALARRGREPMDVRKFSIGMLFTALAFATLVPSVGAITEIGAAYSLVGGTHLENAVDAGVGPLRVSGNYLVLYYLGATLAELCISPVGLSSMSKLAPQRMAGMVMGTWFLATSIGNYIAGRAAGFSASRGYGFLFYTLIISALVVSAALYFVAPLIKRMMASGDAAPGTKSEKAEPEPLPRASVEKES